MVSILIGFKRILYYENESAFCSLIRLYFHPHSFHLPGLNPNQRRLQFLLVIPMCAPYIGGSITLMLMAFSVSMYLCAYLCVRRLSVRLYVLFRWTNWQSKAKGLGLGYPKEGGWANGMEWSRKYKEKKTRVAVLNNEFWAGCGVWQPRVGVEWTNEMA